MELRKMLAMAIGVGAIAAAMTVPASAHNGPAACVLAASPAQVNNIEMGPPSVSTDPMSKATRGHTGQKVGEGNRFGLYYPPLDPNQDHWTSTGPQTNPPAGGVAGALNVIPPFKGDNFNWRQAGSCANGGSYVAGGVAIGYCGRSVGYGTGSIGGHSTIIRWESVATQLVLTDPTAAGSVNAQANPPGSPNGSCLDGGASVFYVDGALVHM